MTGKPVKFVIKNTSLERVELELSPGGSIITVQDAAMKKPVAIMLDVETSRTISEATLQYFLGETDTF